MAVPGDESCRPVADCGEGDWGNIPLEPTTQFVNRSHSRGVYGLGVSGAEEVLLDRIWVHHTTRRALDLESLYGVTSATLANSLIEHSQEEAAWVVGAALTVERSVIRDSHPRADQLFGRGISAYCDQVDQSAEIDVRSSVLERNIDAAIHVAGSSATVEGSVIRDTAPLPLEQR